MEEKFFTPAQVAERLQVVERTIYRWIEAGELHAVKLGRVWRIQESSLQEFIQTRQSSKKTN